MAMSELAWHTVGAEEDAAVGFLRRVEVEGAAVCLGRTAEGWVAFQDTCTHEECSLSDGELEGSIVVCPCHASEFDLRTGDVLSPPALDPGQRQPVRRVEFQRRRRQHELVGVELPVGHPDQ